MQDNMPPQTLLAVFFSLKQELDEWIKYLTPISLFCVH